MLPPTHASRPLTSRASRATWAARRLSRPASAASPKASRRIRFAPNVSGLDQVGAGVEVLAVEGPDQVRARGRELVEAGALGDAAREQQRAHAAVREQRGGGEAGGKPVAGKAHRGKPIRSCR